MRKAPELYESQAAVDNARSYGNRQALARWNAPFVPGKTPVPPSGKLVAGEELAAAVRAVLEMHLTEGHVTQEFERKFAGYLGRRFAAFCNSGSSANLLALSALRHPLFPFPDDPILDGDEVITAATGFPTTVNPILQNRLRPVFCDVELGTYVPTVSMIDSLVTKRTRAIMLAHTLGNPFEVDRVRALCDAYGLVLIEDNCDSLGSTLSGRLTGTWGDFATHSFYPAHHITTGEGGMVISKNGKYDKIIRSLRDWGRDCAASGQPVLTAQGIKPIEEVRVGDLVLNAEGRYDCVTNLTGHNLRPLLSVKAALRPKVIVSRGHRFFVKSGDGYLWKRADELTATDFLVEKLPQISRWNQVKVEYHTLYQRMIFKLSNDERLARILGYYAAEGSLASGTKGISGYKIRYKFHRVDFCFNKKRKDEVDDLVDLMQRVFGCKPYIREKANSVQIAFKSRKAYETLDQLVGRPASEKRLPPWMIQQPEAYLVNFLKAYWAGDGHVGTRSLQVHTVSPHLHEQVRVMLLRLGVVASDWKRTTDKHQSSVIDGKEVVARHDLLGLAVYGKSAHILSDKLGFPSFGSEQANKAVFENGYVLYPVQEVEDAGQGAVYNFEVERNPTYHLGGLISHNCWCPPGEENTCGKRFNWKFEGLPDGYDHKYIYSSIGYNLKSTDLQAAMGKVQLDRLPAFIARRRRNFDYLFRQLSPLTNLFHMPRPTTGSNPAWFGFPLTIREDVPLSRRDLLDFLTRRKIGTRMMFGSNLPMQPAYLGRLPQHARESHHQTADLIARNGFWIGVWPGLRLPHLDWIANSLQEFVRLRYVTGSRG